MNTANWIRSNCRFAQSSPADTLVALLKAGDYRGAAKYVASLPEEQRGQVRSDAVRSVQTEEGGFDAFQKGTSKPSGIDWEAFNLEVGLIDRGWGEANRGG